MSLSYPLRLLLIVLAYVSGRLIAKRLALALPRLNHEKVARTLGWIRRWGVRLGLDELLRLVYYVVVPFAVLQLGWATPVDLGLADLDWVRGIGVAGSVTLLILAPYLWIWRRYLQLVDGSGCSRMVMQWAESWGWVSSIREAILMEASWALIRSAGLVVLGSRWGTYAGLALILTAELLDRPAITNVSGADRREESLLRASIAVVTATVFQVTGNVWLCCVVHAILRSSVLWLMSRREIVPAGR